MQPKNICDIPSICRDTQALVSSKKYFKECPGQSHILLFGQYYFKIIVFQRCQQYFKNADILWTRLQLTSNNFIGFSYLFIILNQVQPRMNRNQTQNAKIAVKQIDLSFAQIYTQQILLSPSIQPHQNHQQKLSLKAQKIICALIGIFFSMAMLVALLVTKIQITEPNNEEINTIITRNFYQGRVYHSSYVLNNYNQNETIKVYYDSTIAVFSVEKDIINFAGSLLKKRQEKIEKNGNITISEFHTANQFLNILQTGGTNQSQVSQSFSNNSTELLPTQSGENLNNSQSLSKILPVYKFSLFSNGSVSTYTFPTQLQKQYVGLFRSITKLFSPLLDKNLYINQQNVVKRKLKQGDYFQTYVGSANDSNFSNITEPDQKYEEINGYNFESSDDGVTLNNSGQVSYSGPTHNTNQVNSQLNQFDQNGQLLKGYQTSNTQFNSVTQEADPNYSVMNLNLSFSSYQTSEMNLIISFFSEQTNIEKFSGLVTFYEQKNQTKTMDSFGLVNYVLGVGQQEEVMNMTTRLLLQADGSLSLLKFNKESKILSTNVLGCQIGAFGYTILHFNLYQDRENIYRKIPKFKAEIGTILKLGGKKFIVPLLQYEKKLPPVSLKFTLSKIEGVVDLIKEDFLSKLKEICDLILNAEFDDNLISNIMKVLTLAQDISGALDSSQNQNSPTQIIRDAIQIMIQISQAIDTEGMSLLNPQNMFIGNLSQQLLNFVNVNYADALAVFNLAKSTYNGLKNQGIGFLNQILTNFTQQDIKTIEQRIKNLIPPDVFAQYEKQIRKAQPILLFIQMVKNNGTDYLRYVTTTFNSQKIDFLKFTKGIVDLYFANQTLKTDSAFNKILERVRNIELQVDYFRNLVSNFKVNNKMNQKTINLFLSLLLDEFGDNRFIVNWNNQISTLQNLANQVSAQKVQCCRRRDPQWWEFWQDVQCIRYNNAYQDQIAEPTVFTSLSESWTSQFNGYAQCSTSFVSKSRQIIQNSSLKIDEKYNKIKIQFSYLDQTVTASNIQGLKQEIIERKNKAQQILAKVGCGGTDNLRMYISKLASLSNFIDEFKSIFLLLKQRGQILMNAFSPDVYNKILDNFILEQNVQNFLTNYKEMEQNTKSIIIDLRSIVLNYDPQQFLKTSVIANNVLLLYSKIAQSLGVICESFQERKSIITGIRKAYQTRLTTINELTTNFFADQINQLKFFLNKAFSTAYSSFLTIPFCQHQDMFSKQISTLMEDFKNFTVIYNLYDQMIKIINRNQQAVVDISKQIGMLTKKFYKLFTPNGFEQYIKKTHSLTQTIKTLVYNVSMDYSNIKQEAKSIEVFHMAPLSNLSAALQFFISSPFTLQLSNMFINISSFVNSSLNVIQSLSFDIIAVIVISKDVLEYFEETVLTFVHGTPLIAEKFRVLCQNFLDLQQTTGQQYINEINDNFLNLIKIVNITIFPNITQRMNEIVNRYGRQYPFTNLNLQKLKEKCFQELQNFVDLSQSTKSKIFSKMDEIIGNIKSILTKLQIGNLNKVYRLAVYIKDEFSALVKSFLASLSKISDYKNEVVKDIRKLFQIGQFLNDVKKQIQEKYNQTVSNIKAKVNETISYFSQNQSSSRLLQESSDFIIKFKNSSSFLKLGQVGQNLSLNFSSIWEKLKEKEVKIKQYVQGISNDSIQLIKEIGSGKQQFMNITSRVNTRIKNISNQFQIVKRKLSNIKSLIFIALTGDFKGTIMSSMKKIINQTNDIIKIDLVAIKNISNSPLGSKIPLVGQLISLGIDAYQKLIPIRDKVIGTLESGLGKIDQFLAQNVVRKMQKLKDGMLYLKSVSDNSDDPKSILLYKQQLFSKKAPIFKFQQPIITAIGIFMIRFDLNYTIDINILIALRDFRSIDCKVVFEAALVMDLRFGYSLAYILQFGLFVSGNVLRAQVTPALEMNNIIPIQLVQVIADIPDLTKDNIVSIEFVLDLGIYAVELNIGFYIAHIWIQLIWENFEICINLFLGRFCLRFKLPVGVRLFMLRHDFGFKINGIEILKKRILTLKIIEWQY